MTPDAKQVSDWTRHVKTRMIIYLASYGRLFGTCYLTESKNFEYILEHNESCIN